MNGEESKVALRKVSGEERTEERVGLIPQRLSSEELAFPLRKVPRGWAALVHRPLEQRVQVEHEAAEEDDSGPRQ